MRIGSFSKKYNTSIDKIYFYIKSGLLVPKLRGKQYEFDTTCEKDFETILKLRSLDFSIKEIHAFLSIFRISGFVYQEDANDIIRILDAKQQEMESKRASIGKSIEQIAKIKSELVKSTKKQPKRLIGFPTHMLSLLECPICHCDFHLDQIDMSPQYVYNCNVKCDCGYRAKIEDGIFLTPNKNTSRYDRPDLSREYYKDIPPELTSLFQRSYNWMTNYLLKEQKDGSIIMETHINAYFFLQNALNSLNTKGHFIVTDKFPEMLRLYKHLIESTDCELDIGYIADDSLNFPIKNECVDLFIDFFSSNDHLFCNQDFLHDHMCNFIKPNGKILGTFFHVPRGKKTTANLLRNYPDASKLNFDLHEFNNALSRNHFYVLEDSEIGYTKDCGSNWAFVYHEKGEEMHLYSYLAQNKVRR